MLGQILKQKLIILFKATSKINRKRWLMMRQKIKELNQKNIIWKRHNKSKKVKRNRKKSNPIKKKPKEKQRKEKISRMAGKKRRR